MRLAFKTSIAVLLAQFLLVFAGIAAQKATQRPWSEAEAHGLGTVRSINTAEEAYAGIYSTGFSPTLAALTEGAEGAKPTAAAAGLLVREIATGKYHDYLLTYKPGARDSSGKIKTYTLTAQPLKWAKGARSFFTDQTGVIRWTDEKRPPSAKDPAIE